MSNTTSSQVNSTILAFSAVDKAAPAKLLTKSAASSLVTSAGSSAYALSWAPSGDSIWIGFSILAIVISHLVGQLRISPLGS